MCHVQSLVVDLHLLPEGSGSGQGCGLAHGPHTSQFSLDAEPRPPLEVWGSELALGVDAFQHLQSCYKDYALS